jgi:amino acid transporter
MRNPTRDLPRVIHSGMPIVIISYLLANASYYFVLPGKVVSSSNTIAVAFGTKVFGTAGGVVLAIAVSLSCFGALNASTFTSGRIVYVAGKEGYIPAIFGTLGFRSSTLISSQTRHQRPLREFSNPSFLGKFKALFLRLRPSEDGVSPWSKTPVYAMLLNAAFTLAYILVGEFGTLLTFYGVAGYSFYFLTVLGLIVLRIREPSLDRPYKTWISTPLIFCCVSLFLISRSVFSSPLETLFVCAFVAAGVPVYFVQVQGWRPFGNK